MFCVGWSYGSALPRPAGADPNPYTTVHPQRARARSKRRACARHPEMARMRCEIRFPMAGSGVLGAQGDGGIQGDAAALEFLDFLEGNEALVNPLIQECGSGTKRLWSVTPGPGGPLRGGFGIRLHGLQRRLFGSWVVTSPRGAGSRPGIAWMWQCANAMDRAPGAGSAQAASGVVRGGAAAKGLAAAIGATPGL